MSGYGAPVGNSRNPYDTFIPINGQNLYYVASDQSYGFAETSTECDLASDTEQRVAAVWPQHYEGNDTSWDSEYKFANIPGSQPKPLEGTPSRPWSEHYEQSDGSWSSQYEVNVRDRMWKMAFDPIPDASSNAPDLSANSYSLHASKPSPSFCKKVLGKIWGSGGISDGSGWKNFWGRRVLSSLATAAAVAIPVAIVILSKSSQASGAAEENSQETTEATFEAMNATVSSIATVVASNFSLFNATTAISNVINATATAFALTNATATVANIVNATTTAMGIMNATASPSNITNATMTVINWVFSQTSAPLGGWVDIAASSSGEYLVAVQYNGLPGSCVYISSNYGVTWNSTVTPAGYWQSVTSSSSGQYLVAAQSNLANLLGPAMPGYIYVSLDYGVKWTQASAPAGYWQSVTSSSSGQYLAVVQSTGPVDSYIYLSSNYGVTWTRSSAPNGLSPSGNGAYEWTDIVSSLSGQYLIATQAVGGYTYVSSNYGIKWAKTSLPYGHVWSGITLSASGQYLAALDRNDWAHISSDYGVTWIKGSKASIFGGFTSIASSSSGQYLIISQAGCGYIFISSDYGVTWIQTPAPCANWQNVAISSCGQYLAADQTRDTAGNPASIHFSSDYGITWNQASINLDWGKIIFPFNSTQFIALGGGGIWTHQLL